MDITSNCSPNFYLYAHGLVQLSDLISEVYLSNRQQLMQKLVTDQRDKHKYHGVLSQKWNICICPPTIIKAKGPLQKRGQKDCEVWSGRTRVRQYILDKARSLYS